MKDRRRRARSDPGWLAVFAAALVACGPDDPGSIEQARGSRFLNHDLKVEWVGADACRECHLGESMTHRETGMGRAFYPLTADNVVEDFWENNEVHVASSDLHYRMFERDGRYFQRQYVEDSRGRELAGEEREMVYVVGSNNHSRSYVTMLDGRWFQGPVCWYPQVSKWELCPGYEIKNEHLGRQVTADCLTCHNGRMVDMPGVRNQFAEPIPHGIGCERCHGPGALHVAKWRDRAEGGTGEPDPTIVNPRRLSPRLRLDVCAQCHLGDAKATQRIWRYGKDLKDYRPGQSLSDYLIAFHYAQQTEWEFGLSAQVDRFVQSRCYQATDGEFGCLTCHNPHVTVYSEDRPSDYFRKKCLSCHATGDCSAPMEQRAATDGQADDCVACHMRRAEPDDQRFTEFTDHWIRRNIGLEEPDHRDDFTIHPMFAEQLAPLPQGEQHYYRARAAYLLALNAPRERYDELWQEAESQFRSALDRGFENAGTWFFLGKTLGYQGRSDESREALARALELDPRHSDANFAYGKTLMDSGDVAGAAEVYAGILENDPDNAGALAEFGRAAFASRRIEEALAALGRAVELEPWDAKHRTNLGMLLASAGRMADAAAEGERAVALDPELGDAWTLYVNAMRESGRLRESREGERYVRGMVERREQRAQASDPRLH